MYKDSYTENYNMLTKKSIKPKYMLRYATFMSWKNNHSNKYVSSPHTDYTGLIQFLSKSQKGFSKIQIINLFQNIYGMIRKAEQLT